MTSDFDLYEDIITEDAAAQVASSAEVKQLQDEVQDSRKKLKRLMEVNLELKTKCDQLETNMSSLIKTCRNEINRKNDVIAQLRREIDGIVLRRTMKSGNSREMRDLIDRLKKTLNQDKPPKLLVPEGPKKIKAKNGEISVTNFSLNDVYTVKIGKTSFSCVMYGDIKKDNPVMTVERRFEGLKEMPPKDNSKCNEPPSKIAKKEPEKRSDNKERTSYHDRRKDQSRRSNSPSRRSDRNDKSSHRRGRSSERDHKRSSDKENSKKSDNKRSSESSSRSRREPSSRKDVKPEKIEKPSKNQEKCRKEVPAKKPNKDEKKAQKDAPDVANLDTTELESLLAEKQQLLANLATEAKTLMDTGSPPEARKSDQNGSKIDSNVLDESAQDANTSIDGLISTQNFLENWPASSFSQQYRTPPPKDHRQRTNSETSNSDFTSAAGISKILKGKLVPGSYVSPVSGMIRTPTPSRDKVGRQNETTAANVTRTRHRSKEVAQAINKDSRPQSLTESLGLDISSSSADETSPVKRPAKVAKKRKRPSLGFSGPSPMHQSETTKRKLVA